MVAVNEWLFITIQLILLSQCLGKTYYCPYRSGGVNYPQYDLYADNIRVDTVTSITFQTKGRNDAHVLLQRDRNNYYSNVIEVVIGGWGNSQSVIRNSQQGTNRATYRVGRGSSVGSQTFMSWNGLNHAINGIRVSYGYGSDGYFIFEQAVNGGWSGYSSWGACSKTCGTGTQSRSRSCTNPAPSGGGADCSGSTTQSQNCNTHSCPIDGGWGGYSGWGACTRTCGTGTQSRSRSCNNPTPQHGGADCQGSATDTQNCNTNACPIDGAWGTWTSWDTCTVTCAGGTQERTRACDNPAAQYGGAACVGHDSETQACNTLYCPIDGDWTTWGSWANCGVTCSDDPVYINRIRACTNPAPQYNGADCAGNDTDTKVCDIDPCPINGEWNSWNAYGECSLTCLGGVRNRTRDCNNPAPAWGGNDCVGDGWETGICNTNDCDVLPPVDGNWGSWGSWQGCSATCGTGVQRRYRDCDSPAPANNGLACWGEKFEENACSGGSACPVGVDGNWGAWSTAIGCTATCGSGTTTRLRSCDNPAPSNGGSQCVGEAIIVETCTVVATCPSGNGTGGSNYGGNYVNACPISYFTCYSGFITCVSEEFICDCQHDCSDGSDENEQWAGCLPEQAALCGSGNGIHRSDLVLGVVLIMAMLKYLNRLF
ncbi:hypothetical protein ACF0H5_020321 [Mactra antiquata]